MLLALLASFKLFPNIIPARPEQPKETTKESQELATTQESPPPQPTSQPKSSVEKNIEIIPRALIETLKHETPSSSLPPSQKPASERNPAKEPTSNTRASSVEKPSKITPPNDIANLKPVTFGVQSVPKQKQDLGSNNSSTKMPFNVSPDIQKMSKKAALNKPSLDQTDESDWRNYGPFKVDWKNWQPMDGGSIVARSFNGEDKPVYLAVNCGTKRLNYTNQSTQWMSWKSPQTEYERLLITDICKAMK